MVYQSHRIKVRHYSCRLFALKADKFSEASLSFNAPGSKPERDDVARILYHGFRLILGP